MASALPGSRFVAVEANATRRPSAEIDGSSDAPLPGAAARLTSVTAPVLRVQAITRAVAPSRRGERDHAGAARDDRVEHLGGPRSRSGSSGRARRSRTNRPVRPGARRALAASDVNATKRPSGEIDGSAEKPPAGRAVRSRG